MKPPHWQCNHCGIVITDSGSEPKYCNYCKSKGLGFQYIGYEHEYDLKDIQTRWKLKHSSKKGIWE